MRWILTCIYILYRINPLPFLLIHLKSPLNQIRPEYMMDGTFLGSSASEKDNDNAIVKTSSRSYPSSNDEWEAPIRRHRVTLSTSLYVLITTTYV